VTIRSEKDALEALIRDAEALAREKLERASIKADAIPPNDPVWEMMKQVNAIIAAERELSDELGREPSNEEISQRSGIAVERVAQARLAAPPPIAIQGT
jgi:hypothetical protein